MTRARLINRLKMLKRQMFGRTHLDLLSRRFVLAPGGEQAQAPGLCAPSRTCADIAGISYRTAYRWVAQYRRFGLAALARKQREDRGERRAVSQKLKEIIEGLAMQKPPLPIAALYRQVRRFAQDLGEKAPSYGTVFNIVRSLGADLATLAHEGTKAYNDAFELVQPATRARPPCSKL
jgi:putative transposase